MKLVDKLWIYKSKFGGYSTLLKNGEDKMYVQVSFRKEQEPDADKLQIEIKDAFLGFSKTKEGIYKNKIVVLDYVELFDKNEINDITANTQATDGLPY